MGLSKCPVGDMPVIGDLGGNIGDESRITDFLFAVEEPLVGRRFPLLNFSNNLVRLCFFQGLVPIDRFHHFFNFIERFPRTERVSMKSLIGGVTYSRAGEEKRVTGGPTAANQLICGQGGGRG